MLDAFEDPLRRATKLSDLFQRCKARRRQTVCVAIGSRAPAPDVYAVGWAGEPTHLLGLYDEARRLGVREAVPGRFLLPAACALGQVVLHQQADGVAENHEDRGSARPVQQSGP